MADPVASLVRSVLRATLANRSSAVARSLVAQCLGRPHRQRGSI
jgi:hypothetical protein